MKRVRIRAALDCRTPLENILIKGWVRTRRDARDFSFLEVNDGSCLENIQVVAGGDLAGYPEVLKLTTGSSVAVYGEMAPSLGKGQKWEIRADRVDVISLAPDTYPLQKKRHSDEFLRTIAHLRPRTNKYGAIFRIRSAMAQAIHQFYHDRGFYCLTAPLITGSDCEGAGEMFRVTSLDLEKPALSGGAPSAPQDFFGREARLTVSGQLSAEMFALALGDVYTFGPAFRAENSNTSRHAAEFWMLEPEMAFCGLSGDMDHAEELVKHLIQCALDQCGPDMDLFFHFVDKSLPRLLENMLQTDFVRISYTEAIDILQSSGQAFDFPPAWGMDLQSEHERYLAERHFKRPVFLTGYPKVIKPFYMRLNDDEKTVAAVDLLVPGIGELIGGSQREERLDVLEERMNEAGLSPSDYWWYLDSRRFGSVPHSGFGMGFERFLMMITGVKNIRDVIPFPRTPGSIEF
jgi:asparaginyl-tRNA synthetase